MEGKQRLLESESVLLKRLSDLDNGEPDELEYARLAASAYETIWDHTTTASPFLHTAKSIVDCAPKADERATQLLGVLQALCDSVRDSGYTRTVEEAECFEAFQRHSATLRNWFIAYGIGVPAVMITNEGFWAQITKSGADNCLSSLM